MGRASSQKGAKGELEVRDLLQPWIRQEYPDAVIVRTPRSGGWVAGRDAFNARGDLMSKGAPFPWCVEIKRRERGDLPTFLAGKPGPIWAWWNEACDDATEAGLAPMLWWRRSRVDWIVLLPREALGRACPRAPLPWHSWPRLVPTPVEPVIYQAAIFLAHPPATWFGAPGAWNAGVSTVPVKKVLQAGST